MTFSCRHTSVGTAMLPVVAFTFEDFYIDNHQMMHQLEPREQQILFFIGLLAAVLGIGGIRAILCPMGAYSLQSYNQHQLLSFFNWLDNNQTQNSPKLELQDQRHPVNVCKTCHDDSFNSCYIIDILSSCSGSTGWST